MRDYRSIASIGAIVLGVLMIIGGIATWTLVSSELADQNITVSGDATWFAGEEVDGPFTAYMQAEVIEAHALDATEGQTYAELPRDSELRPIAMNASFLRASLYTSVVSFGVAAMAIGMGIVFVLIGLGMRDVRDVARKAESKAAATV